MGAEGAERYLLIAGYADGRRGRPGHRVSVFATADDARAQFSELHRRRSAAVWAEVVAVDLAGRLAMLCRFGARQAPTAEAQASTSRSTTPGSAPTCRWT